MGPNEEAKNDDGVAPRRLRLGPRHLQYAVPYSIGVSVLYLLGYWGTFRIDPFEYIGIGDVVKLAVYPLSTILVLGAAFVGAVQASGILLQDLFDTTKRWIRALLPSHPRLAALVYLTALLAVVAVLFIWSSQYPASTGTEYIRKAYKYQLWDLALMFGLWLSGGLAIRLGAMPVMSTVFGSIPIATMAVLIIAAPIVCAFPAGRSFAYDQLRDGCAPIEIDTSRSSALPAAVNNGAYLGYLGGHVFVREWKTGAIVATRLSEGRSLVLLPLDTRADGRPKACNRSRRVSAESSAPATAAE